jgi:hypothetical protein
MPLASNEFKVLSPSDIGNLRVLTDTTPCDQIQSLNVRLCGRYDDISIGTDTVDYAPTTLKANSDFALSIGTTGYIIH